jgi:hypothetical protein
MTIPSVEDVGEAIRIAPVWFRPLSPCALSPARGWGKPPVCGCRMSISCGGSSTSSHQVQGATVATTRLVLPEYGSERTVHAPAELLEMLAAHVRGIGVVAGEWVFSLGGSPLTRNAAGHRWRRVRLAAGLEQFTLHDLRHFHASGRIAAGWDVVTVQRALGHSSATITLHVHSHLWPTAEDRTRAAAARLMAAAVRAPADQLRTELR